MAVSWCQVYVGLKIIFKSISVDLKYRRGLDPTRFICCCRHRPPQSPTSTLHQLRPTAANVPDA